MPAGRSALARAARAPVQLLVAALAALLAACAPALDWREARLEGSGLAGLFPCKPKPFTRQVSLAGASVSLTLAACTADSRTWALAFADMGDPARVGPALEELRRSAAANIGATNGRPLPLAVAGATPNAASGRQELSGRLPDGVAVVEQVAVFARGTRVYQLTALGPTLPAEAADTFFASWRALP